MNLRNSIMCKSAVLAMVAFVAAVMVVLGAAVFTSTTEAFADEQTFTTGTTGSESQSGETWIYVDGQNGDDSNDGKSADKAVKTWDKAKNLLACNEGGIIVVGTVDASGVVSTKLPDKQVVKRESDIVMFNVSGEATFANIDVDGEDKQFDSEVVKPSNGATVNYLSGAVFHNIGYNPGPKAGPNDCKGGLVSSLDENVKILVDGAEFRNNQGVGIFFRPLPAGSIGGVTPVTVEMKSGKVIGNRGYFYHNEANAPSNNLLYIYNALIKDNDASGIPQQYTDYANRTGVVYVCDIGAASMKVEDGAAIFDNNSYDLMTQYDYMQGENQGQKLRFENKNSMLGGGNPNWGSLQAVGQDSIDTHMGAYYAYKSSPSDGDKAAAEAAATSIFTGNGAVIDSNGTVYFGRTSGEGDHLTTPDVPKEQGCDDEPTDEGDKPTNEGDKPTDEGDKPNKEDEPNVIPGKDVPNAPAESTDDKEKSEDKQSDEKDKSSDKETTDNKDKSENNETGSNTPASGTKTTTANSGSSSSSSTPSTSTTAKTSDSAATTPKTADGAGNMVVALSALAVLAFATGAYSVRRREEH